MTTRRVSRSARAKTLREKRLFGRDERGEMRYFIDELIALNLPLIVEPSVFTAAMMASAMPAAISPYSIAVAPDSLDRNARIN